NTRQTDVGSYKTQTQKTLQAGKQTDNCSRVLLSRDDVLLERLPYLRHITRDHMERKSLEEITQFYGVGSRWTQLPEEAEPEPDPTYSSFAIDQTDDRKLLADAKQPMTSFRRARRDSFGSGSLGPARDAIEKLILSDDDIEDD
ncbi:Cell cycle checkpoint protein rad17, partial [Ascosphaera aggregata]